MMDVKPFYVFRHNSHRSRAFTWATSIIPTSDIVIETCPYCDHYAEYPSGSFDVILEGGSRYPDILGCGAYPYLVLSEKAVHAIHEMTNVKFHVFSVGIAAIKSTVLARRNAPLYYRMEIDGICRIDLNASGFTLVKASSNCDHIRLTHIGIDSSYVMLPKSWDGSPLFRDGMYLPRVCFSTKELLDVAQANNLTNFRFQHADMVSPFERGIDYVSGER